MVVPYLFVVSVHVLLCILLVLVILLQPGKGGDVGAAFGGGGGGGQVFGPRGPAGLLARATTGIAVAFMVTSVTLSIYSNKALLNDADVGDEIERLQRERAEKMAAEEEPEEAPAENSEEEPASTESTSEEATEE